MDVFPVTAPSRDHVARRLFCKVVSEGGAIIRGVYSRHSPSLTNTSQPASEAIDTAAPAGTLSQLRFLKVSFPGVGEHVRHGCTSAML